MSLETFESKGWRTNEITQLMMRRILFSGVNQCLIGTLSVIYRDFELMARSFSANFIAIHDRIK